jgi:hypothetical protein
MNGQGYSFEEFTAKKGRFTSTISLAKSGGFFLSAGFHHKHQIGNYVGVKIFFDKTKFSVGIKLLDKEEEGMFKLKTRPDEKGGFFSAKSFLDAYGIDPQKYHGKYKPKEIEDEKIGKIFVIDLAERKVVF